MLEGFGFFRVFRVFRGSKCLEIFGKVLSSLPVPLSPGQSRSRKIEFRLNQLPLLSGA